MRRRNFDTPRNLSIHGELPDDIQEGDTPEVAVVNPATDEEVLIGLQCFSIQICFKSVSKPG